MIKSKITSAIAYVGQAYANFLIDQLSRCKNLDMYEYLMYQAVLLDYCMIEYFDIYLD
jgi:proteasome assembly chaperone (PAC2) family protein